MNWPTVVLIIVMIGAVTSTLQTYLRSRRPARDRADAGREERLIEELHALRERVAVLERIATERNSLLEREFEQLRDR